MKEKDGGSESYHSSRHLRLTGFPLIEIVLSVQTSWLDSPDLATPQVVIRHTVASKVGIRTQHFSILFQDRVSTILLSCSYFQQIKSP